MRCSVCLSIVLLFVVVSFMGCASSPDDFSATYVSPVKYKSYDCEQIALEMEHISKRTVALHQSLKKKADNDAAQMTIGMVFFWPALFFLEGGDGPEAAEYANMKGEYEALRQCAVRQKCDVYILPKSPEEIIKEKAEEEKEQRRKSEYLNNEK